jgi:hypothetical protein
VPRLTRLSGFEPIPFIAVMEKFLQRKNPHTQIKSLQRYEQVAAEYNPE